MENRRYENSSNTDRPYNRERFKPRPAGQTSSDRNFQLREGGFGRHKDQGSSRQTNYRSRENVRSSNEGYNQPDNRFQSRENYPPRDKFQSKENYQPRENRFRSQTTSGEMRDTRYRSRESFQSRDNRFQNRDNRYQDRDNHTGRNDRFDSRRRPSPPRGKTVDTRKIQPKPKIVSDLQITDGKHIGRYLQNTDSPKVRPTMRKLREIMMRILSRRLRAGRFLDLFAGAGIVGFEAISRGALLGTFVERSARMVGLIKKNRDAIGIKDGHAEIFEIEVVPFLKQMQKRRRHWDVIFLDPPYDTNYDEVLQYLSRGVCIRPKGVLVIEHHSEMFFPETLGLLRRSRVITEGESSLSFYERK